MQYEVFLPALDEQGFDVTLVVEAVNWMAALKAGLERCGHNPNTVRSVVCDIQADNSIHVTDATSARVFRLRPMPAPPEAQASPATTAPMSAPPAQEPPKATIALPTLSQPDTRTTGPLVEARYEVEVARPQVAAKKPDLDAVALPMPSPAAGGGWDPRLSMEIVRPTPEPPTKEAAKAEPAPEVPSTLPQGLLSALQIPAQPAPILQPEVRKPERTLPVVRLDEEGQGTLALHGAQAAQLRAGLQASSEPPTVVEPAPLAHPKVEPPKAEPPKVDLSKVEPPKVDLSKVEPPKAEPPKAEPVKPTEVPTDDLWLASIEFPKVDPPKAEPAKAEPPKAEPAKAEPPKAEPAKAEPPKAEPAKAEPVVDARMLPRVSPEDLDALEFGGPRSLDEDDPANLFRRALDAPSLDEDDPARLFEEPSPSSDPPSMSEPVLLTPKSRTIIGELPAIHFGQAHISDEAKQKGLHRVEAKSIGSRSKQEALEDDPAAALVREERRKVAAMPTIQIARVEIANEVADTALEDIFLEIAAIFDGMNEKRAADFVLDLAMGKIRSESGSVLYLKPQGRELEFASVRGPKASKLQGTRLPVSQGIVGFCAREGMSLLVADVRTDHRFYADFARQLGYPVTSLMCAPIQYEGQIYGCIELLNPTDRLTFAHNQLTALNYIGEQLGQMIFEQGLG